METSSPTSRNRSITIRALSQKDLEAVVGIDAGITGRSRRAYFDQRVRAALRAPALHLQFAAEDGGRLVGYVLARRLEGEFGRTEPALRLEVIGVLPDEQGKGIGDTLLAALEEAARKHGILELRTQAGWIHHGMLRFLAHAGFRLGRNQNIDCAVHAGRLDSTDAEKVLAPEPHHLSAEIDHSAPAANDFEALSRDRADVRTMTRADLEAIARLDQRLTGHDRSSYIERSVDEALLDSAIRVSLSAHHDGGVVGYLMAKVDFGDFGRAESVAVIDTIGVDPGFTGQGIGKALLSQLFVNLEALQVERVETVVARENFDLLGFFYRAGFEPSQRLAFVKSLGKPKSAS